MITGTEKIRAFVRELDIAGARFNLGEGSVDAHQYVCFLWLIGFLVLSLGIV